MKEYIITDEFLDDLTKRFASAQGQLKELIHCKDCIHRYSICPMITIYPTGYITFRNQDDWWCFMGKRKEE